MAQARRPRPGESAVWAARWGGRGRELASATRGWLAGRTDRPHGLGEVNGRVDLRGFPLTGAPLTLGDDTGRSAGVRWESLDLAGARGDSLRLFDASIADCVFDDASMVDLRVWGGSVADCSFQHADLRQSVLGAGDWHDSRTHWTNISFDRAKLARAVFTGAVLDRCSFDRPGRLLQIQDCTLFDCSFAGVLDSLVVDGRGHRLPVPDRRFSVDLGRAVLRNGMITGYRLDRVVLPEQEDLVVVRRWSELVEMARWVDAHEPTPDGHRAAAFLRSVTTAPGPDENAGFVCDLAALGDPAMIEVIGRAQSQGRDS